MIPIEMRCVEIARPGGPDVLVPATRPTPRPGVGEVLIHVAYAGVNRPDVLQRSGAYPPPPGASDLPGLEVSGHIAAVGPDAGAWKVGDPVCALAPGGGYAEYCVVPAPQCLPPPAGLGLDAAAALPETCFTVWSNVYDRARLAPGETLLVQGGSSGIGTTAIQIAHALGNPVYATAGSADKCAACVRLGARRAFNYREEDFVEGIRAATGGRGADVILDMVGGDYIPRELKALADDGRLVLIAFLGGARAQVDFSEVLRRRLVITGSTLRPRPVAFKGAIAAALREKVWPLIEAGKIAPVMHAKFPLAQAKDAHALMESSSHVGKIVLEV